MKKIVCVTPNDARYGFALAGVRQVVTTAADVQKALVDLTGDPAVGVVVVDERLVEGPARDRILEMERRWPGLVVVLPAPGKGPRLEDDYARRLIRRAIGYQVRVNL